MMTDRAGTTAHVERKQEVIYPVYSAMVLFVREKALEKILVPDMFPGYGVQPMRGGG
jgi:hypothetical protein